MKLIHGRQIWKGVFTYNNGYDEADQFIDVDFEMDLAFTENTFIGTSSDSESRNLFEKPTTVTGFMDEEKISFVLKYPCSYYKNEEGILVIDKETQHPEIHYLGFWDGDKNSVYGTWEMKVYEEKYGDGYLEEIVNGGFEMQRIH